MIKYSKQIKEDSIPTDVICDVCKKSYSIEKDWEETQEFQHIYFEGGYGSIFGDGVKMKLDICQHCMKKILGEYLVVDTQEEK